MLVVGILRTLDCPQQSLYLFIELLEGNLVAVTMTESDKRQDGFLQSMINQITGNGNENDDTASGIMDLGLIDGFRCAFPWRILRLW